MTTVEQQRRTSIIDKVAALLREADQQWGPHQHVAYARMLYDAGVLTPQRSEPTEFETPDEQQHG